MPEHIAMKRIGDPPSHVRWWLVHAYVTCQQEAAETWLPWRRARLEGRAAAFKQALEWWDQAADD